jgi:hypothetical protein
MNVKVMFENKYMDAPTCIFAHLSQCIESVTSLKARLSKCSMNSVFLYVRHYTNLLFESARCFCYPSHLPLQRWIHWFLLGLPRSYIRKINRTAGVNYWIELQTERQETRGGSSRRWREHCEPRVAVAVAREQFGKPGKGTSAVGSRYQRTGEGTEDRGDSVRV